jgi:hypothetical protein
MISDSIIDTQIQGRPSIVPAAIIIMIRSVAGS